MRTQDDDKLFQLIDAHTRSTNSKRYMHGIDPQGQHSGKPTTIHSFWPRDNNDFNSCGPFHVYSTARSPRSLGYMKHHAQRRDGGHIFSLPVIKKTTKAYHLCGAADELPCQRGFLKGPAKRTHQCGPSDDNYRSVPQAPMLKRLPAHATEAATITSLVSSSSFSSSND
jgi:hypothetical protein